MKQKLWTAAALLTLASLWLGLRFNTFWSTHWKGDQAQYIVLAMKLNRSGLADYNLRHVLLGRVPISTRPLLSLSSAAISPDPADVGDLIRTYRYIGQGYYDEPLHVRAPFFPALLELSHKIFSVRDAGYGVCLQNENPFTRNARIARVQFWAVIVPLAFNFALMALILFWGTRWFGGRAGWYAAFLFAINPVSLISSQRILADDPLAFLVALSQFFFFRACRTNRLWVFVLSGLIFGAAVLTKQSVLYLTPIALIFAYASAYSRNRDKPLKAFLDPGFLVYAGMTLAVSAFWFVKVYHVYGNPLHTPGTGMAVSRQADITGWFEALRSRPRPLFFFTFSVIATCPLFGLALVSLRDFHVQVRSFLNRRAADAKIIFLWLWIIAFFIPSSQIFRFVWSASNQEHRYFYPAYAAIALLAGVVLDRLRQGLARRAGGIWSEIVVGALLIWNIWISVPIVAELLKTNSMLL